MCPFDRNLRPHLPSSSSSGNATAGSDLKPAFDVLDADRDGKISCDDLRSFYTTFFRTGDIGDAVNDDMIGAMMLAADTNEDGFVEYEEFERVITASGWRRAPGGVMMEEVFRVMDKDSDGKISREDLKSFMAWAGITVADEDIEAMIEMAGGDQNGVVSFSDLIRILDLDLVG